MKGLLIVCLAVFFSISLIAQPLSGNKTIKYSGGDYPSIASAISDLNSKGVGSGGVTFLIDANYREKASNLLISATGTKNNPIVFKKSGTGNNPTVTAVAGTGSVDAIFMLSGSDYITFDGIDVKDTTSNTTATTQTEYGYALLKNPTDSNGCQNVTIKNCSISLNKANTSTYGIFIHNFLSNTTSTTTPLAGINKISQTNSYNKIYSNTISNCYGAIRIGGFNTVGLQDVNNEIGTLGGNSISNFGGSGTTEYLIYCSGQNNLKIYNNTIRGTFGSGGSNVSYYAIYTNESSNANIDISNNYISVSASGSSGNLSGIHNSAGSSGTNNTVKIYNNTVKGVTTPSNWNATFYAIFSDGAAYNLIMRKNTADSIYVSGPTSGYQGNNVMILRQRGTCKFMYIDSNTVINISKSGIGYLYGISQRDAGSNSYVYIKNNTLTSLTCTGTSSFVGIYSYYDNNSTADVEIGYNVVSGISSAGTSISGIGNGQGDTVRIYNNKVYNISSSATTAGGWGPSIDGINVSSGLKVIVYNNFISDIKAPALSSSTALRGLYLGGQWVSSSVYGAYFNTIYLDASSTGTNFGTAGIYAGTSPTVELRNNIVYNISIPKGTGRTVAFYRSGTNLTTYSPTSNNNLFYAGSPSSKKVIFYGSDQYNPIMDTTLILFKARVSPSDGSSFTEDNTPFKNVTTKPYDLHLGKANATQCESAGTPILGPVVITTDFDGDLRDTISPDVGADEDSLILADFSSPSVIYEALMNTTVTTARSITATIVDPSGVPTSGTGMPRLYWRRTGQKTYTTVIPTYNGNNSFTFSNIGGGVSSGDTVFYYFVARDKCNPENIGSTPAGAGGLSFDPPVAATPPANPEFYLITTPFQGTYYVGVGKDFPTITAAVNMYNSRVLSGPVKYILTDALYSANETFPIVINQNPNASATNTLTIVPDRDVNAVIKGMSSKSIIKLNDADYVTIDGSNNGTDSRNLKILNTEPSEVSAVIWLSSLGASRGAKFNTIKNCILYNGAYVIANYGIFIGGSQVTTDDKNGPGRDNDNLTIQNNKIVKCRYAIFAYGSSNGVLDNLVITQNNIGDDSLQNSIGQRGIWLTYTNGTIVKENTIHNVNGNSAVDVSGIEVGNGNTGLKIFKNTIYEVISNMNPSNGAFGINVPSSGWGGGGSSNVLIHTNIIHRIMTMGNSPIVNQSPAGIRLGTGTGHKLYYNTIYQTGDWVNVTDSCLSYALLISSTNVTGVDVQNNIFFNNIKGGGGASSYAIYTVGTNHFDTISNNMYFTDGPNSKFMYANGELPTLAAWLTAIPKDKNSLSVNPYFVHSKDFHFRNGELNNRATPLFITQDFSGATRDASNPDIGVYEVGIPPTAATLSISEKTTGTAKLNGLVNPKNEPTTIVFEYGESTAYGTTLPAIQSPINGYRDSVVNATITGLLPNTTYHYRVVATNPTGTATGADSFFKSATVMPFARTDSIWDIWATHARITGTIIAYNVPTACKVEWIKTTDSTKKSYEFMDPYNGMNEHTITYEMTLLKTNTPFIARILASNTVGVYYGEWKSFSTKPIGIEPNTGSDVVMIKVGNTVHVDFDGNQAEIQVFDLSGKRLLSKTMNNSDDIRLDGYPQGIYIVKVLCNGNIYQSKVVVE